VKKTYRIKDRHTNKELYYENTKSFKFAVRNAVKSGIDLSSAMLNNSDLSGLDLRLAKLKGANFANSNLRDTDLSGANLSQATFTNTNISGTKFHLTNMYNVDFFRTEVTTFQYQRSIAYYCPDGTLTILYVSMPISEWKLGYKEILKFFCYSDEQIQAYGNFIKLCLNNFKRKNR
jgi:Pentapeptide repeats (8 copies)